MNTYRVYWAKDKESFVKCEMVRAKQKRTAAKKVMEMYGANILIEGVHKDMGWNATWDLIQDNID